MKLNIKMLIATAIAGLVSFLINQLLYSVLEDIVPKPILIAILVAILALICCGTICGVVMITDSSEDEFLFLDSRGKLFAGLAVCLVVLFLFTMLFEWIYDHEEMKSVSGSSYVFVLDESGSMTSNDPTYQRYEAVKAVSRNLASDVPYAVYMFSNDCVQIRDMKPKSAGDVQRPADADQMMSQTYISRALTKVYDDLKSGKLGGGNHPHVILMTDGYASDMGFMEGKDILNKYRKAGIVVSTVGLGNVDQTLLKEIANKTGGQFVLVSDANELAKGFSNVTYFTGDRDLISPRNVTQNNGLYLFLRILFLTLIGAMVALMKAVACANGDSTLLIMVEGAVAGLVGAILMEIGLALGVPTFICRFVYWMGLAVTPQLLRVRTLRSKGNRKISTSDEVLRGGFSSRVDW